MTPAAVFDHMAANYDALWTATPVGRAQRDQVWRVIDGLFAPCERVLDIGCGTGEDALHLMARGVDMVAVDASAEMVAVARSRGVAAYVASFARLRDEGVPRGRGRPPHNFDGGMSNFGAWNCVADLRGAAREIAGVVRPGGHVAICLMGRVCMWETLYYVMRVQFRKALRRLRTAEYRGMTVYYPSVGEMRAAFSEHFEVLRWTGVGLFVPPSYVKIPALLVRVLAVCDRLLAGLPLLRAFADHRLFILVRK